MFEKYTEKARRTIFFARYAASQFGATSIEAEHILLGLLREEPPLFDRISPENVGVGTEIRKRVVDRASKSDHEIAASVDIPLAPGAKKVLTNAADESDLMGCRYIGTEHLLLGVLRSQDTLAARIMLELGFTVKSVREIVQGPKSEESESTEDLINLVQDMRDLANALLRKCNQVEERLKREQ